MEIPKNTCISNHALMRYASRVFKELAATDKTWDQWKKHHLMEVLAIENEFRQELQELEYVGVAAYNNHSKADYYINRDKMMTYVVVGGTIVTCYPIDYGLDEEGNRDMLEVLLKNLERGKRAKEDYDLSKKEKRAELQSSLVIMNAEIQSMSSRLERMQSEKSILEKELKNVDLEGQELEDFIQVAHEKIVRSKKAM